MLAHFKFVLLRGADDEFYKGAAYMVHVDLEKLIKNVKTAVEESKAILMRIAASPSLRRISFVTLCVLFLGLVHGGLQYLEYQAEENSVRRIKELHKTSQTHQYKTVIDIIDSCLESKEEKIQHQWYCEQAALHYKNYADKFLPGRANEVLTKKLYRAMKVDMANLLQRIELDQIIEAETAKEERYLKLLVSNTVMWTVIVLFFIAMVCFILLMEHYAKQQSLPEIRMPDEN
jgi:hypothetical protein